MKARLNNLEKSYEVLKAKQTTTEDSKVKLVEENLKLTEELAKVKSHKVRLNKDFNDLKSSQATL